MKSYTKEFELIGPVRFVRSRRARNMNITIRPFKGIRVAVPVGVPFNKAEQLVVAKTAWIRAHQKKVRHHEKQLQAQPDISPALAYEKLAPRVEELARKHGFSYNRLKVRRMSTRWGSCSLKNNINLNTQVLRLPEALQEYVILHELVHTVHKNHSPSFWSTLSQTCGVENAKELNRQLKRFGSGVV